MGHRLNYHEIMEIILRLYGPESQRWHDYESMDDPTKRSKSKRKKSRNMHGCESSGTPSRDHENNPITRQCFK